MTSTNISMSLLSKPNNLLVMSLIYFTLIAKTRVIVRMENAVREVLTVIVEVKMNKLMKCHKFYEIAWI